MHRPGSSIRATRRKTLRRAAVACLSALASTLAIAPPAAFAIKTHLFEGKFGSAGTSESTFSEARPAGLGIDQSTGNIYVAEAFFHESVAKFNLEHQPEPFTGLAPNIVEGKLTGFGIVSWQLAVDSATPSHVLYVASGGPVSAYQPDGEPADFTAGPGKGTNELPGSEVCGVAVDASGDVYVSEFSTGIRVFAHSGELLTTIATSGACNLAVDSHGSVYTDVLGSQSQSESGPIDKFTASSPPPVTGATTYESVGAIDENGALTLAVDPSTDHLYVDEGQQIAEYDEAGTRLGVFGASGPGALQSADRFGVGLAVNGTSGRVYVTQGDFEGQVTVFGAAVLLPTVGTGEASEIGPKGTATLNGTVNPEGVEVSDCHFDYGTSEAYGQSAPCEQAVGAGSGEVAVTAKLTGLAPGVTYHFRLQAANANGASPGADASFATPPRPAIGGESATGLTESSADLNATVNPGGLLVTECRFEYGTSTVYGHSEPCEQPVGAGTASVSVSRHVADLEANITYHWRVLATSEAGTTTSPDHTFVYANTGERLPDDRAYEMVTPPHKDGGLIDDGFLEVPHDISEDGSRVILASIQCFGDSESCDVNRGPVGTTFLFSRSPAGWQATALAPPASEFEASSARLVSAEAGSALFSMPTPPMLEDDFYVRQPDGAFVDVGPGTPPAQGPAGVAGEHANAKATSDFSRVAFIAPRGSFSAEAIGREPYEYSGTGNAAPVPVAVSGGAGSTDLISRCEAAIGVAINATTQGDMSADGETIYFEVMPCAGGTGARKNIEVPVKEVYARVSEAETIPISEPSAFSAAAPYPGCSKEPCVKDVNEPTNWKDAEFVGASNDGTKVFFTSAQQLTDDSAPETNLYEYDRDDSGEEGHLIDASAGEGVVSAKPAVQGVVAISTDGSHVYFVAGGVLSTTPNTQGQQAQAGANNLYVFERDASYPHGHVAFIATLAPSDSRQWQESGRANVTPNGRFLVFESHAALTPDAAASHGAQQIFRYDAQTGALVRISVGEHGFNDNGNAGIADARIDPAESGWNSAGPARSDPTMSHDGSFVFFESPVALTPGAIDDVRIGTVLGGVDEPIYAENVYEWHEGQVYLISDGKDAANLGFNSAVHLLGADATGANVFFTTADSLVPQDTDTQVDVYDARICTTSEPCISQPPPALPPCLGEQCHGTPPATPPEPGGGSATLNGQGNLTPSASSISAAKPLSRAQKLARALKICRSKHDIHRRKTCEAKARKRYRGGSAHKAGGARVDAPRRGAHQ
jgi:hypothetical protein